MHAYSNQCNKACLMMVLAMQLLFYVAGTLQTSTCLFPTGSKGTSIQTSSNRFMKIFDFLEKSLLRGRAEKKRKLQSQQHLMKGTSSNIMESIQSRVIILTDEPHKRKWALVFSDSLFVFHNSNYYYCQCVNNIFVVKINFLLFVTNLDLL